LAIGALAVVFFVKAAALALFVTPLWDVPDESGHYGIVQDLADGKGLPLPGRSKVPGNVLADWMRAETPEAMENWAAQHPPLYHALAVPFLAAARAVTDDPHWLFRAPRLLSALCGAAALPLFFRAFLAAGADPPLAFFTAAAIGFVPEYTHMSSGTNHDVFVALLAGVAALYWARVVATGRLADGWKMAGALGAMGLTKLSALPVAVALLALCLRPLAAGRPGRTVRAGALALIAFAPPAAWALRQWLLLGNARLHPISRRRFDPASFFSYLRDYPVVDHTFKNFVGLIGWTGTGGGRVRWFQISGPYLALFLALELAASAGTAVWLAGRQLARRRILSLAAAGLVFAFCAVWLFSTADGSALPKRVLYALLVAVPVAALAPAFSAPREDAPVLGSLAVCFLFGLAYLVNSWEAYEIYGQMRATNGRYFFAVFPFLAIGFVFPATRLFVDRLRRNVLLAACVAALALNEVAFFSLQVIPFYRSGLFAR
jgi:hypothetical protein